MAIKRIWASNRDAKRVEICADVQKECTGVVFLSKYLNVGLRSGVGQCL
jgi:hypothetical protein